MIEKISKESDDIFKEKIKILKKTIPECFTEGQLDAEKLQIFFDSKDIATDNKYSFNWAGRDEIFKIIQIDSVNTLIPDKNKSINFEKTQNIFIEGENLEVLKILRKSYFEKIKMIYLDPPYNTGNDFIYNDKFSTDIKFYLEQTGQTKSGVKLVANPQTSGRFHSKWISFMYARLFLARDFLKDDGIIFISIDDMELHNLILIMNEIFGEENKIANVVWRRKRGRDNSAKFISTAHEYLLIYAKNKDKAKFHKLELDESTVKQYRNPDNDPRGDWRGLGVWSRGIQGGSEFEFVSKTGKIFSKRLWLVNKKTMKKLEEDKKLIFKNDKVYRKLFLSENKGKTPETLWDDTSNAANAADEIKKIFGSQIFDTTKPLPYIRRMIEMTTNENDIILDFFGGSGTTAHALMEENLERTLKRQFIMIQLPEPIKENSPASDAGFKNISELTQFRIKHAIQSIEKQIKEKELENNNYDLGFKFFSLSKSNFIPWKKIEDKNMSELKKQMKLFQFPFIDKYDSINVVYECMIKKGFTLNTKVEIINLSSNMVFKIHDNDKFVYICLDNVISTKILDELILDSNDIFLCIDKSLNDNTKLNMNKQCNLQTL